MPQQHFIRKRVIEITTPSGDVIGEVHKTTIDQADGNTWYTESFNNTYTNPVVVAGVPSQHGGQPLTMRIQSASNSDFEWQVDEWDYLAPGGHTELSASFMVIEAGVHDIENGGRVQAGSASFDHNWTSIDFSEAGFGHTPAILGQCGSYNGGSAVCMRMQNRTSESVDMRLQEEEANDDIHPDEINYWIVFATGSYTNYEAYEKSTFDDNWKTITFDQSIYAAASPIYGAIVTYNGADPCTLRYQNLGSTSVEFFVEEEESSDTETVHGSAEDVSYVVWDQNRNVSGSAV